MLVSFDKGIINATGSSRYDYDRMTVYVNGLIFLRGMKAGKESIDHIVAAFRKDGKIPFHEIFGAYGIMLDTHDGCLILFNDNSCMHGMFLSAGSIGSNFLEIIRHEGLDKMDELAVCEYLSLTRGFLTDSVIEGIRAADSQKYYEVKNGVLSEESKGIGGIDAPSSIMDPAGFMKDIAYALSDIKCVCSLTGGFDSRMVAATINHNKVCDCFISGDNKNSIEIRCAMQAAKAGNLAMQHIRPVFPQINDEYLMKFFIDKGGYQLRVGSSGFRIEHFMKTLASRGYKVLLTGDAGDMHKEFWFIQDLPFYWKRKTSVHKFFKSRVEVIDYSQYLGEKAKARYHEMEERCVQKLQTLTKDRNTQSYLAFGWLVDWVSQSLKTAEASIPIVYAPLQEIEMVRYSYQLLPKGKRMNFFLRKMTTQVNLPMARAATVYGTTASSEWLCMTRDFFMQIIQYSKQALRYASRKLLRKTVLASSVDTAEFDHIVMKTQTALRALEWAKREGYAKEGITPDTVPFWFIERLLNLYFIHEVTATNPIGAEA